MDQNFAALSYDLRTIALLNPRLALLLARGQPWAPRVYNMDLRWDTGAAETNINDRLSERLYQDCWISDFVFTVTAPNLATGSVWKPFIENEYEKRCGSNFLVRMRVEGPDRYEITNEFTPLGAITSHHQFEGKLLDRAWVLTHDQNLFVDAINTVALDAQTQIPTTIRLTLCVKELSGCNMRNFGYAEAVERLREMGILPSGPSCEEK